MAASRTTPPASDAPPPAAPVAPPEPTGAETVADVGGVFEYLDEAPITVLPEGAPPQTVDHGDVVALAFTPTGPSWQRSAKAVTRQPDPVEAAAREQQEAQASAGRQESSS